MIIVYCLSLEVKYKHIESGSVMPKTYVLDTNVLIQAPYALESFEENYIVLPLVVLEELDRLKDDLKSTKKL